MALLEQHSQSMDMGQLRMLRHEMRKIRDQQERRRAFHLNSLSSSSSDKSSATSSDLRVENYQSWKNNAIDSTWGTGMGAFNVVLYEIPPFVVIKDPPELTADKKVQDPGNLNQTRTPGNGYISGLTIELLEKLKQELGISINYYYPCNIVNYNKDKKCAKANADEALDWLDKMTPGKYFGDMATWCKDYQCLVAGALKIDEVRVQKFRMTQPFMDTGFVLVVKSSPSSPPLMSAFFPFSFSVWLVVIAEVIICGACFIYVEGYGTNEALWGAPDVSELEGIPRYTAIFFGFLAQLYDASYWSITLLLGNAVGGEILRIAVVTCPWMMFVLNVCHLVALPSCEWQGLPTRLQQRSQDVCYLPSSFSTL
jgi:hypothetical protein